MGSDGFCVMVNRGEGEKAKAKTACLCYKVHRHYFQFVSLFTRLFPVYLTLAGTERVSASQPKKLFVVT
jgi:hypothetical protein